LFKVDLHIHSTASDGRLSPAEVVRKSVERGLAIIAIADHDTVNGIPPALTAAKDYPQLKIIPSVEISADVALGEVHVLGHFIDYTDPELRATLDKFRNSREERAQGMITKLKILGIHIEWQRVQQIAGSGSIGRPHIAQAMMEKGHITSFKEAFTNYLGHNGPAYVKRTKMTPDEAVKLILKAKGLPVLAHPLTVNAPETLIIELKAAGLIGLEAYYNNYTTDVINQLVNLANKYDLIASGGSDYHGIDDNIETMIGGVYVPMESAEKFIALAKQRGLKPANL